LDKYKGSVDEATGKTGKQGNVAKDTMSKIKKLYTDWEKKVDDINKASQKLSEDTQKYNQSIEDSIRSLTKELENATTEYDNFVTATTQSAGVDLADRGIDVSQELLDNQSAIAELKAKVLTDAQDEISRQQELLDLEKEKTELLKEQTFINANTTEDQRAEASRIASLSDAEKIKEDADTEIAEQAKVFEAEKARIESLQKINKVFLDLKSLDQKEFNALLTNDKLLAMTTEEQELILKLAREKLEQTLQKEALIQMQKEVHDATVNLSNSSTAVQKANINNLK